MKKISLLLFVIVSTLACNNNLANYNKTCVDTIINNNFVYNMFQKNDVIYIDEIKNRIKISYKIINKGKSDFPLKDEDSIISYVAANSELWFIKTPKHNIYSSFIYAKIKDKGIILDENIEIGMKKDIFLKIFNKKNSNCDSIMINNDEFSNTNYFIFKDDKLNEIIWQINM